MRTIIVKKLLIVFISLCGWVVAGGQQYADSLFKYLEIAAKNNPSVQQKYTEYQATLQKIIPAGSLPDPQLSAGVFLKPMELVTGNQMADLTIMQMFPWFGVLRNARDEMSLMANAKFEVFRDTKLQLFFNLQKAWFELYKIRKNISISEKNIEILHTIERLATVRYKSASSGGSGANASSSGMTTMNTSVSLTGSTTGMKSMSGNMSISTSKPASSAMQTGSMGASSVGAELSDLYRIQIEIADLQDNIAFLKNSEQTVIALINNYLNRHPLSPVFTEDTLAPDSLDISRIFVPDSIFAKNPMLRMLEFETRSLSARKKMVTGMGYPMIGFGLNYSLINKNDMVSSPMNGKDMIMPMVSVTLPVYRKKYNAMRKEADLLAHAAYQNYQAEENSLIAEYYQAVQSYQDALRRIKLYGNQYILASKSFELILKSFSASFSDLSDVLRVHQQTLDYELRKVEALTDLNTAAAWLKRLSAFYQIQ